MRLYLDRYPKCFTCGANSVGILRGPRNESYGSYCQRHAEARIKEEAASD